MPLPLDLATSIIQGPDGMKRAKMSIMGIDSEGEDAIHEASFQWWPESFADSISVGWVPKEVPGSSHALMHWAGNAGRTFTFEIVLSTTMKFANKDERPMSLAPFQADPTDDMNRPRNLNIAQAVSYLRAYCYPDYDDDGLATPPVTALLSLPNMNLNENGTDVIWCVMTTCDVTYMKSFPNGRPRLATVSLGFTQIKQYKDGFLWVSRNDLLDNGAKSGGEATLGNEYDAGASPWTVDGDISSDGTP